MVRNVRLQPYTSSFLLVFLLLPLCVRAQSTAGGNYPEWATIGQAGYPRAEGQLITYRGKFYLFNGFTTGTQFLERNEVYDPATNTYRTLGSIPRRADGSYGGYTHTSITLVGDRLWLLGGRSGNYGYRTTDEVWIYDIPTDSWSQGPPLPVRRGGGGLARLGRKLHYVGGFDERSACDVADHWVYDLDRTDLGWQDYSGTSPMPAARNHFGTVTLGGKLYIIAGQYGHEGCLKGQDQRLVHAYDPYTDSWERLADFPHIQSHIEPSTFAYNGKIYSLGGQGSESAKVVEYSPATNTWRTLPEYTLPLRLIAPGARVYEENLIVLGGGEVAVNQARSATRVHNFMPNQTQRLAFHPATLTASGTAPTTTEIILANYSAEDEVRYTVQTGDLPDWLTIDRSSGQARESFTEVALSVNPSGLAPGRYHYTLQATASGYAPATLEISFEVGQNGPPSGPYRAFREAECATVGSSWQRGDQATASAGSYVQVRSGFNSTDTPPPANAANVVSFTFELPRADHYQFFSRVDAPTTSDDSFYYRFNGGGWRQWSTGLTTYDAGFDWRRAPASAAYLPAGRTTLDIAYREDGLKLDKILLSSTSQFPDRLGDGDPGCTGQSAPPTQTPDYWAEAECTTQPPGWYESRGEGSSNDGYVFYLGANQFSAPPASSPQQPLRYTASLTKPGTYYLYLRLNAIDNGRNSLWIKVDSGNWVKFWKNEDGSNMLTRGFEWLRVNDDTRPISFNLSAGTHTITVANREAGTQLDKISLSTQTSLPRGFGEPASNCGSAAVNLYPIGTAELGGAVPHDRLEVYPNPVTEKLQFSFGGPARGNLTVDLFDVNGRRVFHRDYRKEGDLLRDHLDVSTLPPGMYRLQLGTATEWQQRPIIIAR